MKRLIFSFTLLALVATSCAPFKNPPGRPGPNSQVVPPSEILDFDLLYGKNCSGCHGSDGRAGLAIGLGDPVYLAIADDATILRSISEGVAGTAMPAFLQSSGGLLTAKQVDAI